MVNGLKVLAQQPPNAPKHSSEPLTSGKEGAMIIDEMTTTDKIEYYKKLLELERRTLASVTEQRDEFRGLLIELYNDINVIHSGKAVSKLNKLFRDENYN
jgi:hypothetical protein